MKPKLIVVCGPTATGKSDKAVEIALAQNGEIISADSRQVYRGLDIGSGKITQEEMRGIPHHLLDVANPTDTFSVDDFVVLGARAIESILQKGKVPIICGGTGFYIDALVNGIQLPEVPPNLELRAELEKLSLDDLQNKLHEVDPRRYEEVDLFNPVRIIRAIEIATELGSVPPLSRESKYNVEYVYLDFPDDILKERIYKRLVARLDYGMLNEAKRLHENGLSFERMKQLGLEYRYMATHLLGEISYEEMVEQLNTKIWQYAKRQRTWFKKYAAQ
jgi:tRNA dimethylallyltransferase